MRTIILLLGLFSVTPTLPVKLINFIVENGKIQRGYIQPEGYKYPDSEEIEKIHLQSCGATRINVNIPRNQRQGILAPGVHICINIDGRHYVLYKALAENYLDENDNVCMHLDRPIVLEKMGPPFVKSDVFISTSDIQDVDIVYDVSQHKFYFTPANEKLYTSLLEILVSK